jgi:hypothetical protein
MGKSPKSVGGNKAAWIAFSATLGAACIAAIVAFLTQKTSSDPVAVLKASEGLLRASHDTRAEPKPSLSDTKSIPPAANPSPSETKSTPPETKPIPAEIEPTPPEIQSNLPAADLIALLKSHAEDVVKQLDREVKDLKAIEKKTGGLFQDQSMTSKETNRPSLRSPSRGLVPVPEKQMTNSQAAGTILEIVGRLDQLKTDFLELHRKHIKALASNQQTLAHELDAKIQALLLNKHRQIFYDAGVVQKEPGASYLHGWDKIRVGSWNVSSIDGRLNFRYPSDESRR